jgi:hypothetical protein
MGDNSENTYRMPRITEVQGLTNAEFFDRHAGPGRVGLVGGSALADRIIGRAQKRLTEESSRSVWSHACLCEGRRADGFHWVIESDLQFHRRHIQLGVQENRITKYHDETSYSTLAVLDFGLSPEQCSTVISVALDLVANRTRYSLRELVGTAIGMRGYSARDSKNRLAREHSYYCSALVRHVFREAGVDLFPGLDVKQTTPEELSRSPLPHTIWVMQRQVPTPLLKTVTRSLQARLEARRRKRTKPSASA